MSRRLPTRRPLNRLPEHFLTRPIEGRSDRPREEKPVESLLVRHCFEVSLRSCNYLWIPKDAWNVMASLDVLTKVPLHLLLGRGIEPSTRKQSAVAAFDATARRLEHVDVRAGTRIDTFVAPKEPRVLIEAAGRPEPNPAHERLRFFFFTRSGSFLPALAASNSSTTDCAISPRSAFACIALRWAADLYGMCLPFNSRERRFVRSSRAAPH